MTRSSRVLMWKRQSRAMWRNSSSGIPQTGRADGPRRRKTFCATSSTSSFSWSAVTQQVIGQEVGSKIHITNEEVQEWYNSHQKELEGPEEVGLSEIMVSTQAAKAPTDDKAKQDAALPEDPQKVAEAQAKANHLVEE